MHVLYLSLCLVLSKKSVSKKRELRKVVKEKLKISWFMCTRAESFHIKWVTRLLSLFGANLVGSDRNTCIPIILLVCIKSEISLRVCLIYLHHSYPVVSTRQRTSSLDCYLTLQQLDFRLHSLCITPYQAPHTSHRNRYSLVLYSPSHHFRYHHMLFFL